jgi:DNA (cytosine-5)-methyltransferase 3A
MGEKWEKVLSKAIGVNGIHINSALVSAQNRRRIYWTNIGMQPSGLFGDLESIIEQPKDKGILLKDILESEVDEKYFLSEKAIRSIILNEDNLQKSNIDPLKSNPLQSPGHACGVYKGASYIVHNTMPRSSTTGKGGTGPLSRTDGKTYCLDTGNTNAIEIREVEIVLTSKDKRLKQTIDVNNLVYGEVKALDVYNQSIHNRYPTLKDPKHNDRALFDGSRIRRLTPIECERLQTVADNYTNHVSDSQRYKMLGNGWTIDVIAHILKYAF